ncbi:MAG: valine--tRNA ligase [Chloroflexi bacterium]|nr:valine--tRNA ligase [Chloroflexota bacterium]
MTKTGSRREIPKAYDPQAVEQRIYQFWMDGGYFTPEIDKAKQPFTVIMPPPNVTGELHMGHALTTALEDMMVRWHRMQGEPTLFLPGSDHAGIATQVVVERMLAADGVSRHDLGREKFVERVWQWVDQYGNRIYEQLRRLGASCDWSRAAFTLNEGPSKAVRTTFVNLYKKGLIYRGERITNWCPHCRTALSDLEVKYREEDASLYHIRYKLEDGSDALVVATTRPETLLGDTAVAVNPEDGRYKRFIGKNVVLPVLKRLIPVVGDEAVELEFGTGALKVTPGHDPTDFEIGQRHNLPIINIMELDGTMTAEAGPYQGQTMADARKNIVEQLERDGLLVEVEPYHHSVGHCDRSDDVVEPIVTLQWYVSMASLAKPARDAVANGDTRIIPERFAKVYFNWMDNIRDWCISRQLWWGHRIPVWYCEDCDEIIVEYEDPEACPKCGSKGLRRDDDVLDTWFSSGLWTHSTLGWPEDTEDLRYFYPTSVIETGYDILFFWVARMVMLGMENLGDIPFHTIYLHGLIQDEYGEKMSKVKGNVLNPLDVISEYGADALRFSLTVGTAPGNDSRLSTARLQASRNFTNKLWNASRYVMSTIDGDSAAGWRSPLTKASPLEDRWIISRLNRTIDGVQRALEGFRLGDAQEQIEDFLWGNYCDWYIEMAKVRLRDLPDTPSPIPVLAHVLESTLRLLHPFMPFITEELWQNLVSRLPDDRDLPESIMIAPYPQADASLHDPRSEEWASLVMGLVKGIRNVRAERKVAPSRKVTAILFDDHDIGPAGQAFLETLARCSLQLRPADAPRPEDSVMLVVESTEVFLPVSGLFDVGAERERLLKETEELKGRIDKIRARLENADFSSKAPREVVEKERVRLAQWQEQADRIRERIAELD